MTKKPGTAWESVHMSKRHFDTVPLLPVPRLPPEGSLGNSKILGTFHLGPLSLHVENLECRAQKWLAWCQKWAAL